MCPVEIRSPGVWQLEIQDLFACLLIDSDQTVASLEPQTSGPSGQRNRVDLLKLRIFLKLPVLA